MASHEDTKAMFGKEGDEREGRLVGREASPATREKPQESKVICRYPYKPQQSLTCYVAPPSYHQVSIISYNETQNAQIWFYCVLCLIEIILWFMFLCMCVLMYIINE